MTPEPELQLSSVTGESVTENKERHRSVTPDPELSWQRKCPVSVQWLSSTSFDHYSSKRVQEEVGSNQWPNQKQ